MCKKQKKSKYICNNCDNVNIYIKSKYLRFLLLGPGKGMTSLKRFYMRK